MTSSQDLIGIDLGATSAKLVWLRVSGQKSELVNLSFLDLSGATDEEIATRLKESFHQWRIRKPRVIQSVSSQSMILRSLEIPSMDPDEIKDIIDLQAARHTPYSREEIIVDYSTIAADPSRYTKILLVIAPRQHLKRYRDILDKAGLSPQRIVFAPEALALAAGRMLGLEKTASPVSVAHLAENTTEFLMMDQGQVAFVRSFPLGIRELLQDPLKFSPQFVAEIRMSLEASQEEIEKASSHLFLTGALPEPAKLAGSLSQQISLPVTCLAYLQNISLSEKARETVAMFPDVSFLNAMAGVLSFPTAQVNLIPEELKSKKIKEQKARDLIQMGVLTLAIGVLILAWLGGVLYFRRLYLNTLRVQYQPIHEEAGGLERELSRVTLAKKTLANRGYSLKALVELYDVVPENLELSEIRYDGQGKFLLRGSAQSMSAVFSFVESLEKSLYFINVKTRYTTQRKQGAAEIVDFEIDSGLEKKKG